MSVLLLLGLAVISTGIVWWASDLLETSTDRLATYYRLPALVQGAVLTAVGSSVPELSSAVLATLIHGEFELGVAAIVGSAIFNILVIPGISGWVSGELASDKTLVYKDAQFYITAVAVLLLTFSFALIYQPAPGEARVGEMTRLLALLPVLVYGLYLFLQQQDTAEYQAENGAPDAGDAADGIRVGREWGKLGLSLVFVVIGVEGLVRAAIGLGEAFGTPSFLWGLTVVAAGTSLPDLLVSVRTARQGRGVLSLANVLGSNTFDLLVAVPAGVLVAGTTPIDFAVAAPLMGALTVATIVLFALLRTGLTLSKFESGILLGLYAVFLAWMILETLGVTQIVIG